MRRGKKPKQQSNEADNETAKIQTRSRKAAAISGTANEAGANSETKQATTSAAQNQDDQPTSSNAAASATEEIAVEPAVDNEQEEVKQPKVAKSSLSSQVIGYNCFVPSEEMPCADYRNPTEAIKKAVKEELVVKKYTEKDLKHFPSANMANFTKDMDVCMQKDCMKATINLKTHLRKHLYDGDIKEDEFLDLFLHSHAKKLQLCLNPTITKSELDSALKKGNKDEQHNALKRLFVERGITYLNDEIEEKPHFKAGDSLIKPSKIDDADPQYRKKWAVLPKIALNHKLKVDKQKHPWPLNAENVKKPAVMKANVQSPIKKKPRHNSPPMQIPFPVGPEGSLLYAIHDFPMPAKLGFFPFMQMTQAKRQYYMDKKLFADGVSLPVMDKDQNSAEPLKEIPLHPAEVVTYNWASHPFITKTTTDPEARKVMAFYAAFISGFAEVPEEHLEANLWKITQIMHHAITKHCDRDDGVKAFYRTPNGKKQMDSLGKGIHTKIYAWDLAILAKIFDLNLFIDVRTENPDERYTVAIPGDPTVLNDQDPTVADYKNKDGSSYLNSLAIICNSHKEEISVVRKF